MRKIVKWIKKYGLITTILRGIYSVSPVLPVVFNEPLRKEIWYNSYRKSLKKYLVIHDNSNDNSDLRVDNERKIIWWCWLQGLDFAPEIVTKCLYSVNHYALKMDYEVICLDSQNMFDYIKLPEKILNKWKKGYISPALFTDLCRLNLLADYGGIWIDSTVLLTGKIEQEILDADLFLFKSSHTGISVRKVSNWFIATKKPNNPFVRSLRDSLICYWEKNNRVGDYFIMHLILSLLSEVPQFREMFENIPFYCSSYPKQMEKELFKEFNSERLQHILKYSTVHKLTYKNTDKLSKNSLGQFILEHAFVTSGNI